MMFHVIRATCRPVCHCKDPSLASQADYPETTIDFILRRFHVTGSMPNVHRPVDALSGLEFPSDYTEGMNLLTEERTKDVGMDNNVAGRSKQTTEDLSQGSPNDRGSSESGEGASKSGANQEVNE